MKRRKKKKVKRKRKGKNKLENYSETAMKKIKGTGKGIREKESITIRKRIRK